MHGVREPSSAYSYHLLGQPAEPHYEFMTFPAFTAQLGAAGADPRVVAVGASLLGRPVGLALSGLLPSGNSALLHSIFVLPEHRRSGVGTALLAASERALADRGCRYVSGGYVAGRPSTVAVERLLGAGGWDPPETRMLLVESTPEAILRAPWMLRREPPAGFQIVPWVEITSAERRAIEEGQAERAWVPGDLLPSQWEQGADPYGSLGLRYRREVVGWMLTHRLDERRARFSSGWIRPDLPRRARVPAFVALLAESISRIVAAGYRHGTWSVFARNAGMVALTNRHILPYATSSTETRSSAKNLAR